MRQPNEAMFQLKKILNSRIDCFIKYYDFDAMSDLDEDDDDYTLEQEEEDSS